MFLTAVLFWRFRGLKSRAGGRPSFNVFISDSENERRIDQSFGKLEGSVLRRQEVGISKFLIKCLFYSQKAWKAGHNYHCGKQHNLADVQKGFKYWSVSSSAPVPPQEDQRTNEIGEWKGKQEVTCCSFLKKRDAATAYDNLDKRQIHFNQSQ